MTDDRSIALSIIIPTYNRLWSLPRAVDSCRGSTVATEIIVVDDGSTDGTWEWLGTQRDVIALRQENQGKGWAVNRALTTVARGEYVRFLDSDDWLLPGANDEQVSIARATDADVVVSGLRGFNEEGRVIQERPWKPTDDFIARQLGNDDSSHYSAFIFRRAFVADIPHRTEYAFDDRMYILEVALREPRVAVHEGFALGHSLHHGRERVQYAHGLREAAGNLQLLTIYKRILGQLKSSGRLTENRRKAPCGVLWRLAHWIAYTSPEEGAEVAEWVYRLDPSFTPRNQGMTGVLYRLLGFRRAQLVFRFRRALLAPFRRTRERSHVFPD